MKNTQNRKRLNHTILAEGEATGHKHEVFGVGAALYDDGRDGILVLDIPAGERAEVRHEEHRTQALLPGQHDQLIVLEYDHFLEEARRVAD